MGSSAAPADRKIRAESFKQGVLWSVPVVLGYVPIGVAYGVLARAHGLTLMETTLMSAMVYAGSAQFIALQLLAAGSGPWQLVVAAGLVNSRHLLMSASLCRRLGRLSPLVAGVLAFGVTDETFVMASSRIPVRGKNPASDGAEGERWSPIAGAVGHVSGELAASVLGLNLASYLAWVGASAAGAILGDAALAVAGDALGFAVPAMFIGLLSLSVRGPLSAMVAALSGGLSLLIVLTVGGGWNVLLATAMAATIGTMLGDRFGSRPRQ